MPSGDCLTSLSLRFLSFIKWTSCGSVIHEAVGKVPMKTDKIECLGSAQTGEGLLSLPLYRDEEITVL